MGFDKVAADVESLNSKFSVFGVAAASVINDITTRLWNMAQSMVSAFTIDPIKQGFEEYKLQLNSVQTILTNTRKYGTTINDVNDTLNELNKYADLTVYNFGDMTRSIGQFTQAGLDLQTSTTAIKGMSNLAAGFGASTQDLSRGMYQMSQALAAGKIQLMDWRSMINANMGGETFQKALRMVSEEMQTGAEAAIAKQGSFNESLKEGWLTTEVMVETLNRMTVEGASALKEDVAGGKDFWVEQAKSFEDAATKIKTFDQLIDVIKEEAGSGWATSWTYIMGNFEEAKELFTSIGTPITTFIGQMHDARNEVLKFWHDVQDGEKYSGRDYFLQGLANIVEAIHSVIAPIADAFADIFSTVTYVTDEFGQSNAVLSDFGKGVAQRLVDISKGFAEVTKGLKMGEGYYKSVKLIFTGIFGALRIVTTVLGEGFVGAINIASHALDAFVYLLNLAFNVVTAIGAPLVHLAQGGFSAIGAALGNVFGSLEDLGPKLKPLTKFIEACANAIGQFLWDLSNGKPIMEAWETLTHKLGVQWDALSRRFKPVVDWIQALVDAVKREFTPQTDELGHVVQNTYTKISGALAGAQALLNPVIDAVKTLVDLASNGAAGIGSFMAGLTGNLADKRSLLNAGDSAMVGLLSAGEKARDFGKSMADGLGKAKDAAADFISTIDFRAILGVLSAAFTGFIAVNVGLLLKNIRKISDGVATAAGWAKKFGDDFASIPGAVKGAIEAYGKQFETLAKAAMLRGVAEIIKAVALSIAALAVSLVLLSLVPEDRLERAATVMGILFAAIAGMAMLLTRFNPVETIYQFANLMTAASGLLSIGAAMIAFAIAVKIFSTMDVDGLAKGLVSIAAIMFIMSNAARAMSVLEGDMAGVVKIATSIFILAMAMGAMATACLLFNLVDWTSLAKAGLVLLALVGAATALSWVSNETGSFLKLAASMGVLAVAFAAFGAVCLAFTLIPTWGIIKALVTLAVMTKVVKSFAKTADVYSKSIMPLVGAMTVLGVAMLELAVACMLFSTVKPEGMLAAGLALAAVLAALTYMSMLGDKDLGGLEKTSASLTTIAVGLAVFAGVIVVLGSMPWQVLATGIIGMAIALGLLVAAGYAAEPAAVGLMALSESAAAVGIGIGAAGLGMLAFAVGLATLAAMSPAACASIVQGFIALGEGVIELFARMAAAVVNGGVALIEALAAAAPRFIAAGQKLVTSWKEIVSSGLIIEMGRVGGAMIIQFLTGLGETIGAVVAGGVLLIVSVLMGIAQHMNEIVEAGIQVAVAFVNGVALALRSNSGPIWDAIGNLLGSIFLFFVEGIAKIAELIPGVGQDCANKIREAGNSLVPAMEETTDAVVEAADPDGKVADGYTEELEKTNDAALEGGSSIIDTVKDIASQAASEGGIEFSELTDLTAGTMGDTNSVISDAEMADITGGQAREAVAAFKTEISGLANTATDAVGSGLKALTSADFKSPASKQGSNANTGFKSGISNDTWRAAGSSAAASAQGGIGSQNLYGTGHTTGEQIGNGLVAGIRSKMQEVYNAGFALGQQAVKGKKDGAGTKSPSVYAIETGRYIGEGLVIGMNQMVDSVYSAGKDLGKSATSAVSLAANAMDGIDWDANPTITPVLDTSMIDAGLARVFGGNQMLSAGLVASKYALSSGTANDISTITNGGATYQFNLQYDAGTDALQMIQDMTRMVRQGALGEGA